jgi:hypothetical protein
MAPAKSAAPHPVEFPFEPDTTPITMPIGPKIIGRKKMAMTPQTAAAVAKPVPSSFGVLLALSPVRTLDAFRGAPQCMQEFDRFDTWPLQSGQFVNGFKSNSVGTGHAAALYSSRHPVHPVKISDVLEKFLVLQNGQTLATDFCSGTCFSFGSGVLSPKPHSGHFGGSPALTCTDVLQFGHLNRLTMHLELFVAV